MQSQTQRLVYYISKVAFSRWLKSMNPDKIQTFILKNTMLWFCEDFPPNHDIWDRENVLNTTVLLYKKLLRYFKRSFMPYYFIPQLNVLQKIPNDYYDEIIHRIENMTTNLPSHLPKVHRNIKIFF